VISLEEKHNVAIVGCGIIAQTHLHALKKLNSLKVVAVCDADKDKAIAASKKWKIDHYYTDFSKMLSDENISILSVLTPPSSHAFIAIEAIKRGINVVVEKPLTMTTKEAEAIVNALKESKAKMTVVYHWLFSNAMLKSLSLIKEQRIGEVLNVDINVLENPREDPMTSDQNHWSHKLFGGRFGEMLPHPVYVLQSILGDELRTQDILISKRGNLPWMPHDQLLAILQCEKGFGSIYVSFNSPRESVIVDVYGTKGILRIDLTSQIVLQFRSRSARKLSIGKDSLAQASKSILLTVKNALEYVSHEPGDISKVYTIFKECIGKESSEPLVTPQMAYNTVRIVEEICKGIQASRPSVA
jgi:predicted dehydrogenase